MLSSPFSFADRIAGFVLLCGRPPGFGSAALFGAGLLVRNAGDSGEERRGKVVRGALAVLMVLVMLVVLVCVLRLLFGIGVGVVAVVVLAAAAAAATADVGV